ncbi:hypothetical protein DACRYDRAFT_17724 [Dacryopinax primogenitus]|uniref:Uncharacterized protein n=1 Tax=Dacryopinax primogenitus (strain DJM 731) TaxID=1858805 RepID=M5G5N5_DACPD|nr:uncharacterized protein DACRYDRAFT_17724 [Dacryopinax primogenitus]EJT99072.1 hypothetical protein DACRYDRAFT_17724 [Dacryopinax primogenitus]
MAPSKSRKRPLPIDNNDKEMVQQPPPRRACINSGNLGSAGNAGNAGNPSLSPNPNAYFPNNDMAKEVAFLDTLYGPSGNYAPHHSSHLSTVSNALSTAGSAPPSCTGSSNAGNAGMAICSPPAQSTSQWEKELSKPPPGYEEDETFRARQEEADAEMAREMQDFLDGGGVLEEDMVKPPPVQAPTMPAWDKEKDFFDVLLEVETYSPAELQAIYKLKHPNPYIPAKAMHNAQPESRVAPTYSKPTMLPTFTFDFQQYMHGIECNSPIHFGPYQLVMCKKPDDYSDEVKHIRNAPIDTAALLEDGLDVPGINCYPLAEAFCHHNRRWIFWNVYLHDLFCMPQPLD